MKKYIAMMMTLSSLSLYGMNPASREEIFEKVKDLTSLEKPSRKDLEYAKAAVIRLRAEQAQLTQEEKNELTALERMTRSKIARFVRENPQQ